MKRPSSVRARYSKRTNPSGIIAPATITGRCACASFSATEFYADVVGRPGEPAFDRALEELGFHTKWVRVLGTYPQARLRG